MGRFRLSLTRGKHLGTTAFSNLLHAPTVLSVLGALSFLIEKVSHSDIVIQVPVIQVPVSSDSL